MNRKQMLTLASLPSPSHPAIRRKYDSHVNFKKRIDAGNGSVNFSVRHRK
jgi:hypothetical protein